MNTKNYRSRGKATVLLNLLSDIAVIVDGEGNFLAVNDAFEEVTGLSRKELIGNPFVKLNILTPESKTVLLKNLKKRLQGAPVDPYEVYFADKLGEKRCVEVKGKMVSYAGTTANLVVFHDVTLRKENARRLKEYSERMEALVEEKVKEIRDEEEKYRNLFETAPDVIVTFDLSGKITSVNKAIMQHGFRENEIVGSDIFRLVPIEYNQKMLTELKSIAAGNSAQGEIEILTPNGKRNAEYNSNPIWLNGKVVGYQTIIRDVTERKKAEISLKYSEEKFRNLAENSPSMIFIYQKGKVVYANKEAEKATGYTKEEYYSSEFNFLNLIVPENRELVVSNFTKHTKGEDTTPYEYGLIMKCGRRIDAILNTKIITYNGEPAILGIVTDITERKHLNLQLVDSEQRYHALFDEAPLGVLVIDPQTGKPVEFNDVAHTQLGYSREEFSKLCVLDFEAKERADETRAHLARMMRQGGDEFETKHRTKSGEIRDVLVTARAVELAGKTFLYCVFHDITEIRQVQDALMKSETQYRQLVNVAQEGIWVFDREYRTVFVNPRMANMLGYAESEMVGKNLFDFIHEAEVEQAIQYLAQHQGRRGRNL